MDYENEQKHVTKYLLPVLTSNFLQLSAVQFLALLLHGNAESFVTPKLVSHMTFVGFIGIRLQES
jgi:hypothetical protein